MNVLTFRSSKIVYYGPHACENCGTMIVRMGREFGGNAFNQPEGPIYPNTEWHIHVCDPKRIKPAFIDAAALPSPPTLSSPVCKGSYALGTACGNCERCRNEKNRNTAV